MVVQTITGAPKEFAVHGLQKNCDYAEILLIISEQLKNLFTLNVGFLGTHKTHPNETPRICTNKSEA